MECVERAGYIEVQGESHYRQHKQGAEKDHDNARDLFRRLRGLEEFDGCEPLTRKIVALGGTPNQAVNITCFRVEHRILT